MFIYSKKRNSSLWVCQFVLLGVLSGCAAQGMQLPQTLSEPVRDSAVGNKKVTPQELYAPKRIETLQSLSVSNANTPTESAAPKLDLPKGKLTLNADGLPLSAFVHLAFGDVLKLAFDVDPAVASRNDEVTLHISKPLQAEHVLSMVEETLGLFDVAVVRVEHGLRILPKASLKNLPARLLTGGVKIRQGQVVEVIPLQYVEMQELQVISGTVFELGRYGSAHFNKRLNAVVAIGDAGRIKRFKEFVDFLDRPSFENRQLRLVRPIYWQANELAKQLLRVLKVQGIPASNRDDKLGVVTVLVLKSINAILVASPHAEWMLQAESLIDELDGPDAVGPDERTFVYFTRHRGADELGRLVSEALGSTAVDSTALAPTKEAVKPQKKSSAVGAGGLKVVVDEKRNAIIFIGTSSAYRQAVPILESLDIPARQVLIEITVADISLDDTNKLGVEWQLNGVDNSSSYSGVLSTLGGLGVGSAGLSYALTDNLGNVRSRLNALATKGRAKILSSPTLLAMDGETSHMQVGTQISVVTQEVSNVQASGAADTSLLRSFQYIDTGVILDISPTITDFGSISMKLKQEVSEPGAGAGDQPPIFKRVINTVIVAESGQTVLLGGLITHNEGVTKTQVPWLGDIPFLGALFRYETITDRSTELIILITPHIIRDRSDANTLTREYRNRLGW